MNERESCMPQIEYSASLSRAPYRVNFDEERYAEFLQACGVSENESSRMKIKIKGRSPLDLIQGSMNLVSGGISIYADSVYRRHLGKAGGDFGKVNETLDKALRHETKHYMDRKKLSLVCLSRISVVSPMIASAALAYFVHNPIPAFTDLPARLPETVFWGELYGGALIAIHEFEYSLLNPMERSARKFENETREWAGIITMEPK